MSAAAPLALPATAYRSSLGALGALLDALDRRLAAHLAIVRTHWKQISDPGLRGLVVTDLEVDALLDASAAGRPEPARYEIGSLWADTGLGDELMPAALRVLRDGFKLSPFELECLVVCLAPEVDRKYERIFAYLNDDVAAKHATVQLLLQLLCPAPAWTGCRYLLEPDATLLRHALLAPVEDARGTQSSLARGVRLEPAVAPFLLGQRRFDPALDPILAPAQHPPLAHALWSCDAALQQIGADLERTIVASADATAPLVCVLAGRAGAGRRHVAQTVCARRDLGFIAVEIASLLRDEQPQLLAARAFRDSVLQAAPLMLVGIEAISADRERGPALRRALERLVDELGWLLFVAVDDRTDMPSWFARSRCVEFDVATPGLEQRRAYWLHLLTDTARLAAEQATALADALAAKFRLNAGETAAVYTRAGSSVAPGADADGWSQALHAGAARHSAPRLGALAARITPLYRWDDLVLPQRRLEGLRDIVRQVRHRRRVMQTWCFERVLARGKGLNALFHGPSGTGKTMAAEVIANELGMALFRIDLAGVVSKYIGETEKNLARIFREAEHTDAILFFDEADALFGKRTEVRDAHDRYANIETDYLLQQIENFEGIAILASNWRQNIDEAFLRRLHIAVEFAAPTPEERLLIWRKSFPPPAPLGADVDLDYLAQRFDLNGGAIRNICLTAAFLAADDGDGGAIAMRHVVRGIQRELEKNGKRAFREEYGRYRNLLDAPAAQPAH